jgi:hypothetical protein
VHQHRVTADSSGNRQPITPAAQHEIEQHEVWFGCGQPRQQIPRPPDDDGIIATVGKELGEQGADDRIVLNDCNVLYSAPPEAVKRPASTARAYTQTASIWVNGYYFAYTLKDSQY